MERCRIELTCLGLFVFLQLDLGNLPQPLIIPVAGISAGATDENLGVEQTGILGQFFVINEARLGVDLVG